MKTSNNDFLGLVELVEKAMSVKDRSHMRPVIEKELLHYDILFALNEANLLEKLTFQGGTSLRLCYGAPRFSEDLDFTGGYDFKTQDLMSIKSCLEDYLGKRYGLEVTVKEPKDFLEEPENRDIKVSKWQLGLITHPERKDLPKQKIKIEVANIPSYSREPRQLLHNYDFLPDGYSDTFVMVQTLEEIFADKLIAFVNCQSYIRHRDIWDLHWLRQQGITANIEFIKKKIKDYKIDNYAQKIDAMLSRLKEIIYGKEFKDQMSRFLPMDLQKNTLLDEKYLFLLLQETYFTLDTLGFEWKEKESGEIYCTNSLRELTQSAFENTVIMMQTTKDKYQLLVTYGKQSQELVVSPSVEKIAKKLYSNPTNKSFLPAGYKLDLSLQPGEWFVKFS